MFGLREEVGGDPGGVGGLISNDQHFGRPGGHIDGGAVLLHLPLGFGDVGVAGAEDFIDGGAPPTGWMVSMPQRAAAQRISSATGGGVHSAMWRQPARRAGTASISTVENSGALPPGM